ncbi:beta-ketoacyl-ACP synthase III [Agilicoccus flavus]|uniref:beta-ketoacyl-ACP synthase III n=1 Tax=Agilicoccus flavus TaxID=2775968 RepID=UPI001CF6BD60|nr:beta-ketoacyl-ACP synthase III [Agilicoccus flavus]
MSGDRPRPTLRTIRGPEFSAILGIGDHRPERVVGNDEIVRYIDSTDEWIRERSGIAARRQAGPDESLVDMSVSAAQAALDAAGVAADRVGAVIVATISHDVQTPAAATLVADRIGAGHAAAYDLGAACSGFTYGIATADDLVRSGRAEHVLVIGAEKLSDYRNPYDRGTAFVFGDGAGAALVGPSTTPGISATVWGADGSGAPLISQSVGWNAARAAWFRDTAEHGLDAAGGELPPPARVNPEATDTYWPYLTMQGPSVFRWAAYQMAPVALEAIEAAGITPDDLDVFVPHQANTRIIDALVKKIGLPDRVVVARDDLADMANTSAASIPLATARLLREGRAKSGDLALLMGFGAGLTWAAQVVVLP